MAPDATVVIEIFDCSQAAEDQRADIDNGNIWVEGMHQTRGRLVPGGGSRRGAPSQGALSRTIKARMIRVSLGRSPHTSRSMTQSAKASATPASVTSFRTPR